MMRAQREVRSSGSSSAEGGGESSSSSTSCQDCGNKAKRGCAYLRCRTCCKSRGFHCPTHINSTWVPVATRIHLKHHRLILPTATNAAVDDPLNRRSEYQPKNNPRTSGMEGGNFPAQVNSMATFRCVRVSSDDSAVDQYAYQTSVSIGGHTFKGILYDHGPAGISDLDHQLASVTVTPAPPPSTAAHLLYPSPPSSYSLPFNAVMPRP